MPRWCKVFLVGTLLVVSSLLVVFSSMPADGGCYRSKGGNYVCEPGRDHWDWPGPW